MDRLYLKEIIKKSKIKNERKRNKSLIVWEKVNNLYKKKNYLNININSQDINSINETINKPQKKILVLQRKCFPLEIQLIIKMIWR